MIVFYHKNKELLKISVYGLMSGEIAHTKELLAHERDIPPEEITIKIEGD